MTSHPGLQKSYNRHSAQYLTKYKQTDNETWSVNTKNQKQYVFSKIMQKTSQQG